jgi:hypothetical protein
MSSPAGSEQKPASRCGASKGSPLRSVTLPRDLGRTTSSCSGRIRVCRASPEACSVLSQILV